MLGAQVPEGLTYPAGKAKGGSHTCGFWPLASSEAGPLDKRMR